MSQNIAFSAFGQSPTKKQVLIQVNAGGYVIPGPGGTGSAWFVSSASGSNSNSGRSWSAAFLTIAKAVASAAAGDTIYLLGSFNEAVGVTLSGLSFVGPGTTSNESLWTAPDTVAPCLTITGATDVVVNGIRFRPPVANAAISLVGASNQFRLVNSRIQGKLNSGSGLITDGGQSNVELLNNTFIYINTAATSGHAVLGSGYAGNIEPSAWVVRGNNFNSNTYHFVCRLNHSTVTNNTFLGMGLSAAGTSAAPSKCLDISGSLDPSPGCNIVTGNFFGGAYTTALYAAGTNDEWTGNWGTANGTTCVQGVTVAVPAP